MPAFVNIRVGSFLITMGADGTITCPFDAKKSRNFCLISLLVIIIYLIGLTTGGLFLPSRGLYLSSLQKVAKGNDKLAVKRTVRLPAAIANYPIPNRVGKGYEKDQILL